MTQPQEIHQIEYRWEHQQDLVPIASSMSQGAVQSWDGQLYSWVRHPDAEVTPESVRYQLLPEGRAALAWRHRDPEAAKRDDGTHGRPIVTRVFVAKSGLLTPDVAIALCRNGLPPSAGPRQGEVARGDLLPWLTADELRNLTGDWAETLDREAAVDPGLTQLLAVALAEPELPLAIQLRLPYICNTPDDGPQPRLLWGMWRICRPLLGDDGRGWSFSTFEAPLGDADPARLPDFVFRLDQAVHHPPARARTERRVSPYNPGTVAAAERHPEMAAWLVEEYRIRGGESLGGLLAGFGAGAPLGERLDAVYDHLRAVRLLPPKAAEERESRQEEMAGSGRPEPRLEQHHPSREPEPYDSEEQPERPESAGRDGYEDGYEADEVYQSQEPERHPQDAPPSSPRTYRANEYQPIQYDTVTYTPVQPTQAGYSPDHWQPPQAGRDPAALQPPRTERAPALHLPDQPAEPPGSDPSAGQGPGPGAPPVRSQESPRRPGQSHRLPMVSELLRDLTTASDAREFRSVLERIRQPSVQFDQSDRRQACREMQANNWYIPDLHRFNYVPCEHELAWIFRVALLPDLGLVQVQRHIAGWIQDAGQVETRPLIRALLFAPRDEGARTQMRTTLRPALAARLMADYESADLWPPEPGPQESESSGSATSGIRRLFSRGSRD